MSLRFNIGNASGVIRTCMQKVKPSPSRDAYNMMTIGYRDYLAARYLINNDFLIQGLGLSSIAIEKYLKSILVGYGEKREVHMNKWKEIKSAFSRKGNKLFDELDENYLNLLGKAFSLRYYDKISSDSQYSFIKWQVLGELDFMINLIETRTSYKIESGKKINSSYSFDVEAKNPVLFNENYILLGQSKKDFMEREGKAVMIFFDKNGVEVIGEGSMRCEEYNGSIIVSKSIEIK